MTTKFNHSFSFCATKECTFYKDENDADNKCTCEEEHCFIDDYEMRIKYYRKMTKMTLLLDALTSFCEVKDTEYVQNVFCKVYCTYHNVCNKILI